LERPFHYYNQVSGFFEALGALSSQNGAMQSGSSSSNHSTDSSTDPNQRPRRATAASSYRRGPGLNHNLPRGQRMFQVRISPPEGPNQDTLEGIFTQILSNVAGGGPLNTDGSDGAGRGARGRGARGAHGNIINLDFPFPLLQVLHGNPGDYAWGQGGIDAVITQLLNQLDGTGPPPMPKLERDAIPTIKITQEDVDRNLQCTVCMEDFILDEPVRRLNCSHNFHNDCIIPWLELHATCPICRKVLSTSDPNSSTHTTENGRSSTTANTGQAGNPILNLAFRFDPPGRPQNTSATSTTASSASASRGANSSSNNDSNPNRDYIDADDFD